MLFLNIGRWFIATNNWNTALTRDFFIFEFRFLIREYFMCIIKSRWISKKKKKIVNTRRMEKTKVIDYSALTSLCTMIFFSTKYRLCIIFYIHELIASQNQIKDLFQLWYSRKTVRKTKFYYKCIQWVKQKLFNFHNWSYLPWRRLCVVW